MKDEITLNTKLEIAIEVIAAKISDATKQGLTASDDRMNELLKERDELYSGNIEILDKIINIYGKEIKKKYDEVKK